MHTHYPWQTQQWQFLTRRHQAGTFPHALLLHGPDGLGQKDFALALAELMLCHSSDSLSACGKCSFCLLLQANTHPDLIKVELEENKTAIRIDQIREMIEKTYQTPQQGKAQVIIIDHAQSMNIAAANALLKSLEEPSGKVFFLLLCYSLHTVPATVRSRCQVINFNTHDKATIKNWLINHISKNSDVDQLLNLSNYRPLLALKLLKDDLLIENDVLIKNIYELCCGKKSPLNFAAECSKKNHNDILTILLKIIHDVLKIKLNADTNKTIWLFSLDQLEKLAKKMLTPHLIQLQTKILYFQTCLTKQINLNTQLLFEDLFISWISPNELSYVS